MKRKQPILAKETPEFFDKIKAGEFTLRSRLRGRTRGDKPSPNADFRWIWETQILAENRRFAQETAENRGNPQKAADWRLSPQLRPLISAAQYTFKFWSPSKSLLSIIGPEVLLPCEVSCKDMAVVQRQPPPHLFVCSRMRGCR